MYKVLLVASLLLVLFPRNSESLLFLLQSRRAFFTSVTTTAAATCAGAGVANAGIDVSGLKEEATTTTPGRAPNQPPSGPLAGTPLGFQVAGGPRPESEVRKIDEARYQAAGKGPSFLVGVPREQPSDGNEDTKWMR